MIKSNKNFKKSNRQMVTAVIRKIDEINVNNTAPGHKIVNKSKFTLKVDKQQPSSVMGTFENKPKFIARKENQMGNYVRKTKLPITSLTKIMPANKIVITPNNSTNKRKFIRKSGGDTGESTHEMLNIVTELKEPMVTAEMAIQTNENEILNQTLLVGDFKILEPSRMVTDQIDKMRHEIETKKLLQTTRKFEKHSLQDERNLDNLKEFLDKNYITRKPHKLSDNLLEEDRKIIESMDELLQREKPKTESITDIKKRIELKEQELLHLFDHFQKKIEPFVKTKY
ncbi:uncharacterized protein ACRADG_009796 isoform 1-T1 [Cochliomyia hominivorax]